MALITQFRSLNRKFQVVLVFFALATCGFFGAGIYAVAQGHERTNANCDAVKGLREDFIQVLHKQEARAAKSIPKLFPENQKFALDQTRQQYQEMYNAIGSPDCP